MDTSTSLCHLNTSLVTNTPFSTIDLHDIQAALRVATMEYPAA